MREQVTIAADVRAEVDGAGEMTHESEHDHYNPAWGDGRAVVRRPEARDSEVAKANVIRTATEAAALSKTLFTSVERRRSRSLDEMRQELNVLATLAAQL